MDAISFEFLESFEAFIRLLVTTPATLILVFLWGLGAILKEMDEIHNKWISLILFIAGVLLGVGVLNFDILVNAVVGGIMSFIAMGAYDSIKSVVFAISERFAKVKKE